MQQDIQSDSINGLAPLSDQCSIPKRDNNRIFYNMLPPNFSNKISGKLVIDIMDSGIGISKEGLQKLFQPFT